MMQRGRLLALGFTVGGAVACTGDTPEDKDLTVRVGGSGGGEGGEGGEGGGEGEGEGEGDEGGGEGGGGGSSTGGTAPTTTTVAPECDARITSTWPELDATGVSVLSHVVIELLDATGSETLTIWSETGEAVAGTLTRERDGARLRFVPDVPLLPDHSYEVGIELCEDWGDFEVVPFRTGSTGSALACDPTGRSWALDPAEATFLDPVGVGDLIGGFFSSNSLVVTLQESATASAPLRVGGGSSTGQDVCFPTTDLEATRDGAVISLTAGSFSLPFEADTITIHHLAVDAAISADCASLDLARVAGEVDARELGPALGELLGTTDPEELCALVSSFGVHCQTCSSDGAGFCLPTELVGLSGDLVDYALAERSIATIEADDTCATGASCSQAPVSGSARTTWAALGLGLLGLFLHRRRRASDRPRQHKP